MNSCLICFKLNLIQSVPISGDFIRIHGLKTGDFFTVYIEQSSGTFVSWIYSISDLTDRSIKLLICLINYASFEDCERKET